MATRRLLLVHAHPDDESIFTGLTMARYAAEGADVTLVTCTRGELGEIVRDDLQHLSADRTDSLGEHRSAELGAAMAALGVTDHRFLGRWRDSGMSWAADGSAVAADDVDERAFWRADLAEAADALVAVLREVRPQVVVTYDPIGGYGHPDHVQAHRVTMRAVEAAGDAAHRPDLGPAWSIARVFWSAIPASLWRDALGSEPPAFVIDESECDVLIEAPELVPAKFAALRAHASQIRPGGRFFSSELLGREWFRLAQGPTGRIGDDLFAGL